MSQKTLHISSSAPAPQEVLAPLPLRGLVEAANVVLTPLVTRLDAHLAVALRTALLDHIDRGHRHLIVDLSLVKWMDSSALAALVATFQRTGREGGSFAVRTLHERVRTLFGLTRLDRVMPISEPAVERPAAPLSAPKTRLGTLRVLPAHWSVLGRARSAPSARERSRAPHGAPSAPQRPLTPRSASGAPERSGFIASS